MYLGTYECIYLLAKSYLLLLLTFLRLEQIFSLYVSLLHWLIDGWIDRMLLPWCAYVSLCKLYTYYYSLLVVIAQQHHLILGLLSLFNLSIDPPIL